MASIHFDATTVAPQTPFSVIPAGVYSAAIVESEVRTTRNGGQMAVFTLKVVDGEHRGRKVFARINVQNASAEAERIGQSQLSALCHAAGVLHLQDTAQVHGKVVRVKVKIRKDDSYGDSNEVTGFEIPNGPRSPGPASPAFAVPPEAAPAATTFAPAAPPPPPWKRVAA